MSKNNEMLNAELIAAVKDVVEAVTGAKFEAFFNSYRAKNQDQPDLTETA